MYRSILVPVDDTQQSFGAVSVAGLLASACKSSLMLFHVRMPVESVVTDIVTRDKLYSLPIMEKENKMFDRCRGILSRFNVTPATRVIESPNVASTIVEECRDGKYDVIVMGHRGRTMLKQLVLGSVANGVLVEVSCPVILVHMPISHTHEHSQT